MSVTASQLADTAPNSSSCISAPTFPSIKPEGLLLMTAQYLSLRKAAQALPIVEPAPPLLISAPSCSFQGLYIFCYSGKFSSKTIQCSILVKLIVAIRACSPLKIYIFSIQISIFRKTFDLSCSNWLNSKQKFASNSKWYL